MVESQIIVKHSLERRERVGERERERDGERECEREREREILEENNCETFFFEGGKIFFSYFF